MDRERSTREREREGREREREREERETRIIFLVENLKGNHRLKNLDVVVMITLRWMWLSEFQQCLPT